MNSAEQDVFGDVHAVWHRSEKIQTVQKIALSQEKKSLIRSQSNAGTSGLTLQSWWECFLGTDWFLSFFSESRSSNKSPDKSSLMLLIFLFYLPTGKSRRKLPTLDSLWRNWEMYFLSLSVSESFSFIEELSSWGWIPKYWCSACLIACSAGSSQPVSTSWPQSDNKRPSNIRTSRSLRFSRNL